MRFMVWDENNSDREFASVIDAFDHESAASAYAESDVDGNIDGIYTRGVPIMVEADGSPPRRFVVTVDYVPEYFAKETT